MPVTTRTRSIEWYTNSQICFEYTSCEYECEYTDYEYEYKYKYH